MLSTKKLALALSLCAMVLTACSDGSAKGGSEARAISAVPVEVAVASIGNLAPSYQATGTLEAQRDARLVAERAGEIVELLVEEGDRVQKGQLLARLDPDRAQLALAQAASVRDRVNHDVARNEQLIERKIISRESYDQTRFELDSQQAQVALAQLDLSKTHIRAPYAGVITRRHIKQGQWLAAQAVAFEIADFSELKTRIDVPERAAQMLKAGQAVQLSADALPKQKIVGEVERVAPIVDTASGTVAITIAVDSAAQNLRPGLFVRASVNYQRIENALIIPRAALVKRDGRNSVFVIEGNKASEQVISIGQENGAVVQVLSGLDAGAQVAVVGQASLYDGVDVEVINADSIAQPEIAAQPVQADIAAVEG